MKYNRGGFNANVLDIGKLCFLRQHILYPGERLKTKITGTVNITAMRQKATVRLHVSLEAFAAPLRWYQADFTDYIMEGIGTSKTIDTIGSPWVVPPVASHAARRLGIGNPQGASFAKVFAQFPASIHNEHYRWHEDAKTSVSTPLTSFLDPFGPTCVNLPSGPTRIVSDPTFDALEYQIGSATVVDVRDIAEITSRFSQASKTDWTGGDNRYMQFIKDVYKGGQGSNEVDQVPIKLRTGASLSVNPWDLYATNSDGMGEKAGILNFDVNHDWANFIAPEHMIICYCMLIRFLPVFADGVSPMAYPGDALYSDWQGDMNLIANHRPVNVKERNVGNGDGTVMGKLGAGWVMREGFSHIDTVIEELGTFPVLDGTVQTAAGYRDAANIADPFRSTALRHALAELNIDCIVDGMVPTAGQSVQAGGNKKDMGKSKHPTGGFLE